MALALSPTARILIVSVLVVGIGAFALFRFLYGEPKVHLVVPLGRAIELSANGQVLSPTASVGKHQRFDFKQGDYTLRVKEKLSGAVRTYALKLNSGFDEYVLPISERQCFTRLDVTRTMYGNKSEKAPTIVDRITSEAPFSKKSADYLDRFELPRSIKRGTSVRLLVEVDCAALKGDDRLLLGEAGY